MIYSFKDYGQEAQALRCSLPPGTRTVLDVACGTAEHHRTLAQWYELVGIDLNDRFLELARDKNPQGEYLRRDMRDFRLGKRFDAVVCLFSSIGYVESQEELNQTLSCFASHLTPGGMVAIEPWFQPADWRPGRVSLDTQKRDDLTICRMGKTTLEGNRSIIAFDYLLGTAAEPTRHFQETHTLTLFTQTQMEEAFEQAGLTCQFSEPGLSGRGVYLGRPADAS